MSSHLPVSANPFERRSPLAPATAIATPTARVCRPPWWNPDLYPFTSRFCLLPEGAVHYVDEGKGPVLLFLPPAPLWSFMYRNLIVDLRRDFRCVAMDFPGFGPSLAPPRLAVNLQAMSVTVGNFITVLDLKRVTLVGHDSGGLIGLHAAGKGPERIAGLVLADTFGWSLPRFSPIRGMLRLVSSPVFAGLQERGNLLARLVTTIGVRRRKFTASERDAYLRAYPDRESRRRPLRVFREMATNDAFLLETERGLSRLKDRPVLSIFGQFDPVRLMGFQNKFAGFFPRHRGVVILGEAHFAPEGAPDEMIAAIRAWRQDEFSAGDARPSHG